MLWHAVMAAHVLPTYPTGFLPGRKPQCPPQQPAAEVLLAVGIQEALTGDEEA